MKFKQLIDIIRKTHFSLQQRAVSAVDRNLTVRNWLIGFYIAEFEQKGEDRAKYGEKLLEKIAEETKNIKGFSHRNLKLFRQFYSTYPQIGQTLSAQFQRTEHQEIIGVSPSELITIFLSQNIRLLYRLKKNFKNLLKTRFLKEIFNFWDLPGRIHDQTAKTRTAGAETSQSS